VTDNSDQIEYWNGQAGDTWVRAQERLDAMLEPLSSIVLDKAAACSGERVIDVGCGCGATSLSLAASGAEVWGVDISAPMLARARERAAGLSNVVFSKADAATAQLTADHQLIFSRFGVMFFSDPLLAFKNLHSGLSDDGRMVFMCWQAAQVNPWITIAGRAIQPFLPPAEPVDPKAPGPFAFADKEYLNTLLVDAGFSHIEINPVSADLHVGDDLVAAMQFQGEVGPLARVLAELSGENKEVALQAVREAFTPLLTESGLNLEGATWLVSARRS
jgi:SAM-dependent methyltransferase